MLDGDCTAVQGLAEADVGGSSNSRVHGQGVPDEGCIPVCGLGVADMECRDVPRWTEPSHGSGDASRLWKIARREVGRKWDILKLWSSVLD